MDVCICVCVYFPVDLNIQENYVYLKSPGVAPPLTCDIHSITAEDDPTLVSTLDILKWRAMTSGDYTHYTVRAGGHSYWMQADNELELKGLFIDACKISSPRK